ncbi:MAG: hypothetical protein P8018_13120 [Acidobacteriota bacterium]
MDIRRLLMGLVCVVASSFPALYLSASQPVAKAGLTCGSPHIIGVYSEYSPHHSVRPAIAFNGKYYMVAWVDTETLQLHVRLSYKNGEPASAVLTPSDLVSYPYSTPALLWDGTHFNLAWSAKPNASDMYYQICYMQLDGNGSKTLPEKQISYVGLAPNGNIYHPVIAFNNTVMAVAYEGGPLTDTMFTPDIFVTLLNKSGEIAGNGALHDIGFDNISYIDNQPSIAWSWTENKFYLVWRGMDYQAYGSMIFYGTLTSDGVPSTPDVLASAIQDITRPTVTSSSSGLFFTFLQQTDTGLQLKARPGVTGYDMTLSTAPVTDAPAAVISTSAEYEIFFAQQDPSTTTHNFYLKRIDASGVPVSGPTQLTGFDDAFACSAAMGYKNFMVAAGGDTTYGNTYGDLTFTIGCNTTDGPPGCPAVTYLSHVTGGQATMTWAPASTPYNDLAYYKVYQDAAPVDRTVGNSYTFTGLSEGVSHNFVVVALNAASWTSTGCAEDYATVVTDGTFRLDLAKGAGGVVMNWSDGGTASYNVFRGTDPRALSPIASTADLTYTDPAATGSIVYYYSVDAAP